MPGEGQPLPPRARAPRPDPRPGRRGILSAAAPPPVLVLSGERGAGKSFACRAAAAGLRAAGRRVGGLLSLSRRDAAGLPWELELEDLATGERRPLASRSRELGGPALWPAGRSPAGGAALPPWSFSAEAIAWGLGLLEAGLAEPPELLVLDEVGPLELEEGLGFRPFLDRAAGLAGRPALLLSVRPALALGLAALFPPGEALALSLDEANRATLPALIAELV